MFNVKIKLRNQKGYATPKGPNINNVPATTIQIDGTVLDVCIPVHTSSIDARKPIEPKNSYLTNELTFRSYSTNIVANNDWKYVDLLYRSWSFNGEWFSGPLSEISMYMGLMSPESPDESISMFHPRAFENAISSYITQQFSKNTIQNHHCWLGPVKWKSVTSSSTNMAYFEVEPVENYNSDTDSRKYLMFPISDNHIVVMIFRQTRFLNKSKEELDRLIDTRPMDELMDHIINSIELSLSDKEKEHQKAAVSGLENTHLTDNFPPLKWPSTEVSSSTAALETPNK